MRKHPLRKFFGLFVLYAAVIIGIFVLQFKTQSVFSQSLKNLTVTLYQNEDEFHQLHLKNQFLAEFNGIVLFCDESNAITAVDSNGAKTALTLSGWNRNEVQFTLSFNEGASLIFTPDSSSSEEEFTIKADLGENISAINIPYRITNSITLDSVTKNRLVIFTRENSFALHAHEFSNGMITFTSNDNLAVYAAYSPVQKFTFDIVAGFPKTDAETYNATVAAVRQNLVLKITDLLTSPQAELLSEGEITSYVAEMTATGRYNEALDAIPASFRMGNKRTYFSSPYFNTLQRMNENLEMQTDNLISMIDNATATSNADIFSIEGISDFIVREKKTRRIHNLLSAFQTDTNFAPNLIQASAILNVYNDILPYAKEQAALLESVLEPCIEVIESSCDLKDDVFTLSYNGNPASILQYAESGTALIRTGDSLSRSDLKNTGRLLVNTALSSPANIEYKTLAQVYPVLVRDNKYYPHTEFLGWYGSRAVWAWTCSPLVNYEIDDEGVVNINIDFTQGLTNYVIFKGVPTFHAKIEIQGMMFRTDPRFETYNSSGYVYNSDTNTLLLKSRHKNQTELVRLFCDPTSNFSKN